MSAADWIMHAATHNAPPDRREWAQAMEAEFETLERGKFGWAMGCWSAMLQWRIATDGGYVLLLLGVLGLSQFHTIAQGFVHWLLSSGVTLWNLDLFATVTGIFPDFIEKGLFCAIVCAYRPDKALLTASALILAEQAFFVWFNVTHPKIFEMMINRAINKADPIRSFGAPMFVAIFAEIGMCFVGCQLGIAIHRLLHRKR